MNARGRLVLALVLLSFVAALEFWGGIRANSLALMTDAVHVCMDLIALGIALFAIIGAARPANARKTFGYGRIEVLGALLNGSILLAATGFIAYEAVRRFSYPVQPHGVLMGEIAAIGLIVNTGIGVLLARHSRENLNLQAALFHIAGDALGAIAVIAGGAIIAVTGYTWIDPALSLFVACIIVAGVYRVVRDASDVLLESVPHGMQVDELREAMSGIGGIVAVHDLHVWTIGTGIAALSAHVLIEDRRVSEATAILNQVDALLRDRFGIAHVTLQFECENCEAAERVVCTQPITAAQAARRGEE